MQPLTTVGLSVPQDFPAGPYEGIHAVVSKRLLFKDSPGSEYAGAWNAVAYRYLACAESDEAFTKSIVKSASPPPPERYDQERELFSFFLNGLSSIESMCYAFFALASTLRPQEFPFASAQDWRMVTPEATAGAFRQAFPKDPSLRPFNPSQETVRINDGAKSGTSWFI